MVVTATSHQVLRRLTRFQGIVMAVVLLIATSGLLTFRWAADRVRQTDETLVHLEGFRSEVLNAETGLRGYALVGREEFLEPYTAAFPRVRDLASELRGELSEEQQARFRALQRVFAEWRQAFSLPVLADLDTNRQRALDLIASGAGKRRIDNIREATALLELDLRQEQADRRAVAQQVGWIGIVASVLGIAVILGVGGQVRRRLVRRISGPLEELADVTGRFGSGDLGARAAVEGVDEVQRVAAAFNQMAARTESMVVDLRAVDRLKSEFVSVVSHELRTPLTSIRGSLGLLASGAMGELPPDAMQMLTIATSNTDRLVRLINDILDLERIEGGHEALDVRPCDVAGLLEEAAAGVAGSADAAGVIIEVHPLELTINADRDRLVQALTNLLGNAIKFSDPGGRVRLEAEQRNHQLVLRVEDEGRGIPPEKFEAVFERFHQVDASDAREKGGTGLGLAIVRTIADRHGGRVELTSEVGVGSCFAIVLPLVGGPAVAAEPAPPRGTALVVLVEDDADLRTVLGRVLESHGLDVQTAETADEAIERCRAGSPDLLVLDVQLAAGSGFDVVQALRQDDRLRSLPTVVYTVVDLTAEQRDRLRLGETVFVSKGQRTDEDVQQEVLDLLERVRS